MEAKTRKQSSREKKKGKKTRPTKCDADFRKNPDLVHSMNEIEQIILDRSMTDSEKVLKSLHEAVNSENRKDTLTLISAIQKNPSAVCQQSLSEALLSACDNGNKFLVQGLLAFNADVNCRDERQNTPLMLCAMNGFCDIARLLIQRGADINCINSHGDSALILSVTNSGSTDMVQLLLDQKDIDISHKNHQSHTCLSRAVELLDFSIIKIIFQKTLLNYSYERQIKNNTQQMISHAQNVAKSLGILKIFDYMKVEITENKSALLTAVSQSDLESVNFLLNFVLSKNLNEEYFYESLMMQVLRCYEERNTGVSENDIEIVRYLIKSNVLVLSHTFSCRDEDILAKAISVGNHKLLDVLCQFVVNNSQVRKGLLQNIFRNGLRSACNSCSCECLSILLKYKSDIVQQYDNPTYFIKKPLEMGAYEFFELFLSQTSSLDIAELLKITIETGQTKCFNLILNKFPLIAASFICNSQSSMLHTAAKVGNKEIITKLLELGADVNQIYQDKTPLMYCRKPGVANILLQHGADIHYKVKSSQLTVILNLFSKDYFSSIEDIYGSYYYSDESLHNGKLSDIDIDRKKDLISLFIQHGADVEAKDSTGKAALMKASMLEGFEKILEILLKSGADPNKCNDDGKTALHFAVSENCLKNVQTLLNCSADVNKKCHVGLACLHLAAKKSDIEMFKELLKHGADVKLEDSSGNTPLLLVTGVNHSNSDVLKYLLVVGSNVNHKNKEGSSALMIAAEKGSLESLKCLFESGADINTLKGTKNVVDILVEKSAYSHFIENVFTLCLKYVLENGGSAANVKTEIVFELISHSQFNLIQKLIFAGLSPAECPIELSGLNSGDFAMLPSLSPLCFALLNNKVELAQYFNDISFVTALDICNRERAQIIRIHLNRMKFLKCTEFLDDFYTHPMSLEKLCLITVSSSLGSGAKRENKVTQLPLPNRFKEKLMYRTESVLDDSRFSDVKKECRNIFNLASFIIGMDGSILVDEDGDYIDYGDIYYGASDDSYDYDYYDDDS
ncbi:hypothetical protein Btru_019694 [Bulinus truncatus]|nr:hypothetical protein Btru_019694 [Bulinus truncatus]